MATRAARAGIVYVAGHTGLAGSAIHRALKRHGYANVVTEPHYRLDLTQARAVDRFFDDARPTEVILAAALVGGILANSSRPADFIRNNLQIQTNVIDAAFRFGARKLVFLGSSCIYPRLAPQPLREEYLLTGELEPTNEAYAIAKLAGIKMCQAYRRQFSFNAVSVLPTNLYGPNDNYDENASHVIPGLIRRMHDAKVCKAESFEVWGTGTPRREFLHADDFAEAIITVLEGYSAEAPINIGSGEDVTIAEIAELVRLAVGFEGRVVFDPARPDGTPRKLLDVTKIRALGWQPKIALPQGLADTYQKFLEQRGSVTGLRRARA
jgi:GDP-L-fucose synthase